jgi:ribosome-interacting GTPase 1
MISPLIHRDYVRWFRYARIRGKPARHGGQKAGLICPLTEGNVFTSIIELYCRTGIGPGKKRF